MGERGARYPMLAWVSAVIGMFIGALSLGFGNWQGYFLGLPFLLMGNTVSALITGQVVYPTNQYSGLHAASRHEKPGLYWFAIFMMCFVAWWLFEIYRGLEVVQ